MPNFVFANGEVMVKQAGHILASKSHSNEMAAIPNNCALLSFIFPTAGTNSMSKLNGSIKAAKPSQVGVAKNAKEPNTINHMGTTNLPLSISTNRKDKAVSTFNKFNSRSLTVVSINLWLIKAF